MLSIYCGYLDILRVDHEPSFTASQFRESSESSSIIIQASQTEAHNALVVGEKYHALLRRVFNTIRIGDQEVRPILALQLAVNTINDKMGPDGLVPGLLVYGHIPRFAGHDRHATQMQCYSTNQRTLEDAAKPHVRVLSAHLSVGKSLLRPTS